MGITAFTETASVSFPQLLDFAFPPSADETPVAQIGQITYVGDGVVHVVGLDKTSIDEIVEVYTSRNYIEKALILSVSQVLVEAVVLGDFSAIKRGDQVRSTGRKLQIPTGSKLLGRVINPLGRALDGLGPIPMENMRSVEFPAPGVMDREPIIRPLHTGIAVIDAIIPIGKGQRELVIGDRKTGKTRTLIDIISNQKDQNIHCVYVGVGMQAAKAKTTLKLLADRDALKYTSLVIALADDPPSLQYIAPYVGTAIAEGFMYDGKDALIIYDDLSKQAKAYRQVSLLLKRSPGRDAYPGDIFFLHSRLLERASQLSPEKKGGSLTALPIAETQSGDVSDYIITNLMSITDGHVYLDSGLLNEGILPAVNSGTSVSRVGGKVQSKLLQKVGELTSRILIRYEEVKSYETINTEVSEETISDIKRGKRMKEVFSQDSAVNLSLDEEIILLGLTISSRLDHLEPNHISTFKNNLIDFYRQHNYAHLRVLAHEAKDLSDLDPALDSLFASFSRQYKLPIKKTL
ncbi:F0F1 ATP synthase subunit alpha [Microgenomates group bacterium RIFCSPLOWO2_01_FULL_47_10]|nr:MAG: F0F1 ATP synthase subunit alpha [Microgenomates group bacterium RIFCSPLOWO2_01_FULL_47_10]